MDNRLFKLFVIDVESTINIDYYGGVYKTIMYAKESKDIHILEILEEIDELLVGIENVDELENDFERYSKFCDLLYTLEILNILDKDGEQIY